MGGPENTPASASCFNKPQQAVSQGTIALQLPAGQQVDEVQSSPGLGPKLLLDTFLLLSFSIRRGKNQCNNNEYVIMNPPLIALVQHSHKM